MASPKDDLSRGSLDPDKSAKDVILTPANHNVRGTDGSSSHEGEDVLALQDLDPVLNMKMHLVNNVSAPYPSSSQDSFVFGYRSVDGDVQRGLGH